MTTTRDLIQRMAEELDTWLMAHHYGGVPPEIQHAATLVAEARAYLAQPEPEEPTDEDLHDLWHELYGFHPDGPTSGDVAVIARYILARWGRPAVEPETNGKT
jgi:hypothetical protein